MEYLSNERGAGHSDGTYNIWAETTFGDKVISSEHIYTKASARLLVTIGSFRMTFLTLLIPLLVVLVGLLVSFYYLGRRRRKAPGQPKGKAAVNKLDPSLLSLIRKRLEKHVNMLQRLRHRRVLTSVEKEIKAALESALDQIDNYSNSKKAVNKKK